MTPIENRGAGRQATAPVLYGEEGGSCFFHTKGMAPEYSTWDKKIIIIIKEGFCDQAL